MPKTIEEAYILGLWCADGYHRTSSIGLSNVDVDLIRKFSEHLLKRFPRDRLRMRVYIPRHIRKPNIGIVDICDKVSYCAITKAANISYHIYVNSRPLLRELVEKRKRLASMDENLILSYIAGRFDGDGSIGKDLKRDFRITYTKRMEAEIDKSLISRIRPYQIKVYCYRTANTYCCYVSRFDAPKLAEEILPYSIKLQKIVGLPRRD